MQGVYLRVSPWTITPISETLINEKMRKEGYKINKNPYLTLVPEINSGVEYELPRFEPVQKVEVDGIKLKPNIEKPVRIVLDVSSDMVAQIWRDELINQIPEDNIIGDLEELHVTLLEIPTEDDPMSVPIDRDVRNDIVERVDDFDIPSRIICTHLMRRTPEYMQSN